MLYLFLLSAVFKLLGLWLASFDDLLIWGLWLQFFGELGIVIVVVAGAITLLVDGIKIIRRWIE